MIPEQIEGLDPDTETLHGADRAQERMKEKRAPETRRIQCAHCTGYYDEDEIRLKNLCYKCEEDLDDYCRILGQRNLFLSCIDAIRTTWGTDIIHGMCEGILAAYKEE